LRGSADELSRAERDCKIVFSYPVISAEIAIYTGYMSDDGGLSTVEFGFVVSDRMILTISVRTGTIIREQQALTLGKQVIAATNERDHERNRKIPQANCHHPVITSSCNRTPNKTTYRPTIPSDHGSAITAAANSLAAS
jgi:hypothetical protein